MWRCQIMDHQCSPQDLIRCNLCETPVPPKHCDICHTHLCEACLGKHLSDQSKEHYIVPFEMRGITVKCPTHSTKHCTQRCQQCRILICSLCVSSSEHKRHQKVDILRNLPNIKELIKQDLEELQKTIHPKYQKIASNIPVQRADIRNHSKKLTTALDKQGEALHLEINNIVQEMKLEIDDMDAQHIAAIDRQEDAINHTITEITQVILDLKMLLDTSDVCLVSAYTSRNEEFSGLPAQLPAQLPTFTPKEINKEQIHQQIGSLSKLALKYPVRTIIRKPRIITDIQTKYGNILRSMSSLNDSKLWTCADDDIIRLYNQKGELLRSVQTISKSQPEDIAVTRRGDLVYADYNDSSINLVNRTQSQTLITLRGWKPRNLCSTSSGDLLVIMTSNDWKHTKVVRYSDSSERQSIQLDDQGKPLFKSSGYLAENRNLNICVADFDAGSVIVVSRAGKLRFRYTGSPSTFWGSSRQELFSPVGITTDSQANILTSDYSSNDIDIID
uniref:Uncharacterized protein LOC111127123 n=1 Tax=Crassostrea virginica TaxID=6565 RepID=A0A8B8DJU4_CRAVI|nr:uncharacterized protein LOC111127123 [Crassostrea virginica]